MLAASLTVIVVMMGRTGRFRLEAETEREQRAALERDGARLERQMAQLQTDHQFLMRFFREFPHVAQELHDGRGGRRIPGLLLKLAVRVLEPAQAVMVVRRRATGNDPSRGHRFVVAATAPESCPVEVGAEISASEGPLGFAADVQRVMDRSDFESQPPGVRGALARGAVRGFAPDLVAPLVADEETVGILAVQGLKRYSVNPKDVLRVIAQSGALAVRSHERLSRIKATANLDGLTGILNKRVLGQRLAEEAHDAIQNQKDLSVFLFDIDNFKSYNDRNGHMAGDQLLKQLARVVQDNVRGENLFGRFGGEEFMLVLPGTSKEQGIAAAENIRSLIAEHPFDHAAEQPLGCLSISGGVATCPEDATDSAALLRAADEALYAAKKAGRNRVRAHQVQHLGTEAQEPVEPTELPEGAEPGEIEAEDRGPLDPLLLPDPTLPHDATTPLAGAGAPLATAEGTIGAATSDEELVIVDDGASWPPPSNGAGRGGDRDTPAAGSAEEPLSLGPAWIEAE